MIIFIWNGKENSPYSQLKHIQHSHFLPDSNKYSIAIEVQLFSIASMKFRTQLTQTSSHTEHYFVPLLTSTCYTLTISTPDEHLQPSSTLTLVLIKYTNETTHITHLTPYQIFTPTNHYKYRRQENPSILLVNFRPKSFSLVSYSAKL